MTHRIAIVVPSLEESGGVTSVALFIRKALRTRPDYEVKWISLATSASDPCSVRTMDPASWVRGVSTRSGQIAGEPLTHVGALFGEVETQRLRQRKALTELVSDCDLIQIVAGAPCWALPFSGLGIPVVTQVATLVRVERRRRMAVETGPRAVWRRAMTRATSMLDERALRIADAVMVENAWMYSYAESRIPRAEMVRYAPPGVDTSLFYPLKRRVPKDGFILTVGRLDDPRKNVGLLLEAYTRLIARRPDGPRLVLAGATGPHPSFWIRAAELGVRDRVTFIGAPPQSELIELYRNAQTFALASDEEGFGVVLIEAMACGIPVVSTRSGGPEGIILDGANGFLVPRDDADALANRLLLLAEDTDLNLRAGERAVATVKAQFSQTVTAKAYLDLYDEILNERASQRRVDQCAA